MKLGTIEKQTRGGKLRLERRMIGRQQVLEIDRTVCIGCPVCRDVCPQGAVTLLPAKSAEGRLETRATVDLTAERCNFCGECVVICPFKAVQLTMNGTPSVPVLEYKVFPVLEESISVDVTRCDACREQSCMGSCPAGLIEVRMQSSSQGAPDRVADVLVDRSRCFHCGQCEVACPEGAISVQAAWEGTLAIDERLCPPNCTICATLCPTGALRWDGERVVADAVYCLFCMACADACPLPEALLVARSGLRHQPVKSGAWLTALLKLISPQAKARSLASKAHAKWRRLYETRMV